VIIDGDVISPNGISGSRRNLTHYKGRPFHNVWLLVLTQKHNEYDCLR